MTTNYQKYKDYYTEYYRKNKHKNLERYKQYNRTRPTARKNFVGIKIDDKIYCFKSKRSIDFIKLNKDELQQLNNIVYV